MNFCSKCGAPLAEGSAFCTACGASQPVAFSPLTAFITVTAQPEGFVPVFQKPEGYVPVADQPEGCTRVFQGADGTCFSGQEPVAYIVPSTQPDGFAPVFRQPTAYVPVGQPREGSIPVYRHPAGYAAPVSKPATPPPTPPVITSEPSTVAEPPIPPSQMPKTSSEGYIPPSQMPKAHTEDHIPPSQMPKPSAAPAAKGPKTPKAKKPKDTKPKKRRGLLIWLVIALILALAVGGAMLCWYLGVFDNTAPSDDVQKTAVTLTIWTPEEDQGEGGWLENRLAAFEAAHPEYEITWQIDVCSEDYAGGEVKLRPYAVADIYMFDNSSLDVLYENGALLRLEGEYLKQVQNDYSEVNVNAVTYSDGGVYGFPMTCSDTCILYYNKDTYTEEDIKSLDTMLAKGDVWFYMSVREAAAFFLANGCTMCGEKGNDPDAGIQFGGQQGHESVEAMIEYSQHPNFNNDSALPYDAVIGDLRDFDYDDFIGDNIGFAALPTVTIAGKQVQLKYPVNSKAIGVNPRGEHTEVALELAAFLSSAESQLLRYELRGVIPAHKELVDHPSITESPDTAAKMAFLNNCAVALPWGATTPWGATNFWSPMGDFTNALEDGEITLDNYKEKVDQLYDQLNEEGS